MKTTKVCALTATFWMLAATWVSAAQLTNVSRRFEVSGAVQLVVELSAGDVLINPVATAQSVQVDVVAIDQNDVQYLNISQSGSTVRVEFKPQGRWNRRSPRFEFTLPADAALDLNTAGGDITVTDTIRGTVEGKTAGGDIELKDVEGSVRLRTSGGDISAGVVRGDCDLSTSGGDIRLEAADGEVVVKTSGGDIQVGDVGRRLEASTAGGDIRLGNVGGSAVAKTAGGDIHVGNVEGSAELKTAGGDVVLTAARGSVEAKTAGGDLQLSQVEGPIQASTAGGDIVAELLAASAASSFKTAGGNIDLKVARSARVTVHALIHVPDGKWSREGRDFGIESGFGPVQVERDQAADELRAVIPVNGGGVEVVCETSNGWIRVNPL